MIYGKAIGLTLYMNLLGFIDMNQNNKCKLFGHTPDYTIIKEDKQGGTHDTLCMACQKQLCIIVDGFDDIWGGFTVGRTSDRAHAYENLTSPFIHDLGNSPYDV